jgi:hypothetical protein
MQGAGEASTLDTSFAPVILPSLAEALKLAELIRKPGRLDQS